MNPTLLAIIICIAAATLEGALAGGGVRQRLAELRMPPYSPPFALWLLIGAAYYAICLFVLRHLLASPFAPSVAVAVILLILVLLGNALWSVFFFRWRDLRVSFVAFIPYAFLIAALVAVLASTYPVGAVLFLCYCVYLAYAIWWGYRLWLLMNRTVYVVGTLHRYQGTFNGGLGATATKDDLEQFRRFLKEIVHKHGIRSVAEEMSVEALQKYPHPDLPSGESLPLQVANELSRPHEYCCPPDRAARDELGLSPDGIPDTPDDTKKREAYWLDKLKKLDSFPCLFVLGSDHADSFPNLLNTSHLEAISLVREWKPTPKQT